MEPGAFDGCSNLYNLTINKDNKNFEIENGILYFTDNTVVSILPAGLKETITIREGVKELITQGTFVSAYNLKTLNLPSTLQEFSGSIFPQSSSVSLTNINFPNGNDNFIAKDGYVYSKDGKTLVYVVPTKSKIEINEDVETIAENALFFNCKVTELVIPDNVINLESRCFANCPNLRKIEIGSGVQYIDPQICVSNNYMIIDNRTITIDSNNKYYKMENGFILTKDGKKLVTSEKTYIPDCIVPEGVEEICDYALYRVAALTVELPSTLKKIGDYSFSQNTYIEKIEIPNSIEYIGTGAFGSCINLSEVRIDKERDSISGSPWEVPKGERAIIWLR